MFPLLKTNQLLSPLAIIYHDISDATSADVKHQGVSITTKHFEKHIRYLSTKYSCIGFSKIPENLNNSKAVVVTFDDGFKSIINCALPILEKYHVPAKLFLTLNNLRDGTNWLCKLSSIWDKLNRKSRCSLINECTGINIRITENPAFALIWKNFLYPQTVEVIDHWFARDHHSELERTFLNNDEIKQLSNHPLLEFGSHTKNHFPLNKLPDAVMREEIVDGHLQLKQLLPNLESFAIPFGTKDFLTEKIINSIKSIDSPIITAYGGAIDSSSHFGVSEFKRQMVFGSIRNLKQTLAKY